MPLNLQQQVRFRNVPEQVEDEFTFDGGLVTDKHESKLTTAQSPNNENILYNDTGSIKTRYGTRVHDQTIKGGEVIVIAGTQTDEIPVESAATWIAQTFTLAATTTLLGVQELALYSEDAHTTQQIELEIWSTLAGEPDALLHKFGVVEPIHNVSANRATLYFVKPPKLTSGVYALVMKSYGPHRHDWNAGIGTGYGNGGIFVSDDSGAIWSNTDYTTNDLVVTLITGGGIGTPVTGHIRFNGVNGPVEVRKHGSMLYGPSEDPEGVINLWGGVLPPATEATLSYTITAHGTLLIADGVNKIKKYRGATQPENPITVNVRVRRGSATVQSWPLTVGTFTAADKGRYVKLGSRWHEILSIQNNGRDVRIEGTSDVNIADGTVFLSAWGELNGPLQSGFMGDFNGDDTINSQDITLAILNFGDRRYPYDGPGDMNGDGYVNQADLDEITSLWGQILAGTLIPPVPVEATSPRASSIAWHNNRFWALDGNSLYFSVLDTFVDFDAANDFDTIFTDDPSVAAGQINIPPDGGDGVAIYSFKSELYIFQKQAIWRVKGFDSSDFEVVNVTNDVGLKSRQALSEWEDLIVFLDDQGLFLFDGSNYSNISDGVVNKIIKGWRQNTVLSGAVWDNKHFLSGASSGSAHNNEILYYDFVRKVWGLWTNIHASVFWVNDEPNGEQTLYYGSSDRNSVMTFDTTMSADMIMRGQSYISGSPIKTVYETPALGFKAGINDKAVKKFYLQQAAVGDWDMTVTMFSDISAVKTPATLNLQPIVNQRYWGQMKWGENWAAEGTLLTDRVAEFQGLGKYFKFRFEQEGYRQGLEILALVFTSRLRRLR